MSTFKHAAYDTYDTVEGVVNDVFERQNPDSLRIEKPLPEVSAEDLLKKKYNVDVIPEKDFDRLMTKVQEIQAGEGLTSHPLSILRKMWEEEQRDDSTEEPKDEAKDGDKDSAKDGAKDEKKPSGWFSYFW